MKIAFITPDITARGGVEKVISKLSQYFCEVLGHEVEIISYFKQANDKIYMPISDKVKVTFVGFEKQNHNGIHKVVNYINTIKGLNKVFDMNHYDIVFGFHSHFNFYLALNKKRIKGKVIGCEHGQYYFLGPKWRKVRKHLYKKLDCVVSLTERDAKKYAEFSKKVVTIPNSLPIQSEEKADLSNKRIITVGTLDEYKGFQYIIEAFSKINMKFPEWKLAIVGDGEYKETLEEKIKKLNLSAQVEMVPFTPNIKEEYLKSSIYTLTSLTEAFPMVLLEAMELGLPCIAFDCRTGPKEIITDGEDGILVDVYDVEGLTSSLEELIKNEKKRFEFGAKAKENIQRYCEKNIFEMWEKLLLEMH